MAFNKEYFRTPPVVKNLLIINFIIYLAQTVFQYSSAGSAFNSPLVEYGGLVFAADASIGSWLMNSYRVVTYMFLHGDFAHIFSNMFSLWMFGRILEYDLGSKRFFIYYMLCGIGAGVIQLLVNWASFAWFGGPAVALTIGASGAVFGLLLAFGMMRPNSVIMLLFPPIPMKAKWFVIIYGLFELTAGVRGTGGNIAHFAHLGGMLIGFLILKSWKKKRLINY